MGNFHHGADRNRGREDRRDGGRGEQKVMHRAVCSECGNDCEVPFRPSNDKPVFCNDCFKSKRDERDSREHGDRNDRGSKERYVSNPREDRQPRQEFARPVPAPVVTINNEETKKQFSEILNRLDKLTQALEMSLLKKEVEVAKVVAVKTPVVKKVEAKKAPAKKVSAKKKK